MAAKLGCVGSIVTATWFLTVLFANTAPARADAPPTPGIKIYDETSYCTSAFTAQGNDGRYFLMTSGHCDAEDNSLWTYGEDQAPLGRVTAKEYGVNETTGIQTKDAALIELEPGVGMPPRNFSRWMSPVGVRRLSCRSPGGGLGLVG